MKPFTCVDRRDKLKIDFGVEPSPFGMCVVAQTEGRICFLGFCDEPSDEKPIGNGDGPELESVVQQLCATYPNGEFIRCSTFSNGSVAELVKRIFSKKRTDGVSGLSMCVAGTDFQQSVWQQLLRIPKGEVESYSEVASWLGRPTAVRAVAGAIAKNPVSYLIPCHRVISKNGTPHNYRWGATRKQKLIETEMSCHSE